MTAKEQALLSSETDEMGDLDEELAPLKPKIARREYLRKKFVARAENEPADQPCTFEGKRWNLKLSARTMKRVFKPGAMKRLATVLGDVFFRIADFPLGKFDDYVTIDNREKYVVLEQTGYRTIEAIEKPAMKKAA
jgi:hypothetical protein